MSEPADITVRGKAVSRRGELCEGELVWAVARRGIQRARVLSVVGDLVELFGEGSEWHEKRWTQPRFKVDRSAAALLDRLRRREAEMGHAEHDPRQHADYWRGRCLALVAHMTDADVSVSEAQEEAAFPDAFRHGFGDGHCDYSEIDEDPKRAQWIVDAIRDDIRRSDLPANQAAAAATAPPAEPRPDGEGGFRNGGQVPAYGGETPGPGEAA